MSDSHLLRRSSSGMLRREESVLQEGGFHAKYEPKEVLGRWECMSSEAEGMTGSLGRDLSGRSCSYVSLVQV